MAYTSEELKNRGNRYFSSGRYQDAIQSYTQAIIKNPKDAKLFTNRALAHIKLQEWDACLQDCTQALTLDPWNIKAYVFAGQALLEQSYYDEAIIKFQKALNISRDTGINFGDDITQYLRIAKSKRWAEQEKRRISREAELEKLLLELLEERKLNEISKLSNINDHPDNLKNENISALESQQLAIEDKYQNYQQELLHMFQQIDEQRKKRDIPDYLCGKISYEIMTDPVITPSGITYDRKDIEEHLQRVGHFDPITRTPLTADQLIPNLVMKEVVDAYIAQNPWVIDY